MVEVATHPSKQTSRVNPSRSRIDVRKCINIVNKTPNKVKHRRGNPYISPKPMKKRNVVAELEKRTLKRKKKSDSNGVGTTLEGNEKPKPNSKSRKNTKIQGKMQKMGNRFSDVRNKPPWTSVKPGNALRTQNRNNTVAARPQRREYHLRVGGSSGL